MKKPVSSTTAYTSFLLLILWCLCVHICLAQPGTLDPGFSGDGKLTTTYGVRNARGNDLVIQSDGKIILGGSSWGKHNDRDFALERLNPDGSLDASFGKNGKVITQLNSKSDELIALALQPDGKILALGNTLDAKGISCSALVRYNPNGDLDTTFGDQGIVLTRIGESDAAISMILQKDGKILTGGRTRFRIYSYLLMVRYLPDGSLDTTFSDNGHLMQPIGPLLGGLSDMAIQADGKIVVTGAIYTGGISRSEFFVGRFNSNGKLDLHFGFVGRQVGHFLGETEDCFASAILIQPDGKILISGTSWSDTMKNVSCLARLLPDGSLDDSFGINGKSVIHLDQQTSYGQSIAIQSDGKIIIAATVSSTNKKFKGEIGLIRCNADGNLDTSFVSKGIQIGIFPINAQHYDYPKRVRIQPDSKILVVGTTFLNGRGIYAALLRFLNDE